MRSWLRRKNRLTAGLLVPAVALASLVVLLVAASLNDERDERREARVASSAARTAAAPARRAAEPQLPPPRPRQPIIAAGPAAPPPKTPSATARAARPGAAPVSGPPRAAIVIDDLGQSLSHLEQLADLHIPLSVAVIPGLPASARTVREASRRGIELLLHQPMEPREEGGKNPGEGVLLSSMSAAALRARVRANLALVPGAVGVNNHMGSRFTEDAVGLGALMAEIREHDLFWLDSRTTSETRGVEVARALGVPAIERDIFIDAEQNVDFVRAQVRKLIEKARTHGTAVGIGHPHPETIAILRELRAELLTSGVVLVPVSALVPRIPAAEPGTALAAATARPGSGGGTGTDQRTATP